uniref:Density-regulated protein n=1 Tax=Periophthalmus magnuspinnatus TaxID=409849 RepID=A0A3B4AVN8_9GOBI
MATTEIELGSSDNKSEQGPSDSESKYPLKYCEYMPEPAKCRQWLEKNFPDVFARMTQEPGTGDSPPVAEEEEKKKQKRGGRGQIKQKKKTVPQKVTIARIPRAKKKYVTRVCGLGTFDIDLKEAQRFFAQKFSCGASVTAEDEIIIQGDFTDDIIDVIQEKWPEVSLTIFTESFNLNNPVLYSDSSRIVSRTETVASFNNSLYPIRTPFSFFNHCHCRWMTIALMIWVK